MVTGWGNLENLEPEEFAGALERGGEPVGWVRPWEEVAEAHRRLLWGDESRPEVARKPCCYDDLLDMPERKWLCMADFFRMRHAVFLRGVALGSEGFVQQALVDNLGAFLGLRPHSAGEPLRLRSTMVERWRLDDLRMLKAIRFDGKHL